MHSTVAVIPCYNHPDTIGLMVQAVRDRGLDVVVVDDGSHADCAAVLDALAVAHAPALTLVRLAQNQGKGGAMMAGLQEALRLGYSHALQLDADGQHDASDLPRFMAGGPNNPLGARALYLGSSLYRIHGSNEPHTIGTAVSSGCFRLTNDDVIDLYSRVRVGTRVVVLR